MIKYEAFKNMCYQAQRRNIADAELNLLIQIAYRQVASGQWPHGKPLEIFVQDHHPCIRYQNGMWWHYDLVKGQWF